MAEKIHLSVRAVRDALVAESRAEIRSTHPDMDRCSEMIQGALAAQELLETLLVSHTEEGGDE